MGIAKPVRIANDHATIAAMNADAELARARRTVYWAVPKYRYTYNFTWYGTPIIQFPEDILAVQEILLSIQPTLVIETGIAHGGSLMLSASMLALLGRGEVVGVDLEIRPQARAAIESHPLAGRITLVEGSSTDDAVVARVRKLAAGHPSIAVFLDSNHTHVHVLKELELYSPLVTQGSYLVVSDTGIEALPKEAFPDRPWGPGNSPATAVREFLNGNRQFVVDNELESRLMFSSAPGGYLRRVE